jgi:hypothetical protein
VSSACVRPMYNGTFCSKSVHMFHKASVNNT